MFNLELTIFTLRYIYTNPTFLDELSSYLFYQAMYADIDKNEQPRIQDQGGPPS